MLTELQAINIMLRAVGQSPITTAGLQHPHAIVAQNTLVDIDTEVQARGWWFNEDKAVNLLPDDEGHIIIPGNALNCDPTKLNNSNYPTSNLVQRGSRMYDPINNTFVISEAVECDIRYKLEFGNIPHCCASYIAYYAALEFQADALGDQVKLQRLTQKVFDLHIELKAQDVLNRNINAQTSPNAARLIGGVRPALWG